jgi:hypothetical protein
MLDCPAELDPAQMHELRLQVVPSEEEQPR